MNGFVRRLLTALCALLLIVYVGYQVFVATYTSVSYETAVSYSVYDLLDVQGIAVRNEQILPSSEDGYLYYTLKNGDRVSSGGTIAAVYESEQDAALYEQITRIDKELETLRILQRQGTASKTNLDAINAQIRQKQSAVAAAGASGETDGLRETREELLELLNRKQIAVGKVADFSARIAALAEKRSALYAQYTAASRTVQSPLAGYFVSRVDGYENLLSYPSASLMTVDTVRTAINTTPAVSEGAYVGKVVGDYEWYLACIVPTEKLSLLSVGGSQDIKLPFVSGSTIPVTVEAVNKSGDEAAVILRCGYMSEALSSARCEQVQLLLTEYTGLYVPDEALHFNENKEAGVYVRVGNLLRFRRVDILYYSENGKYAICSAEEREGYLSLYDDMAVEGKDLYDGKLVD